MADLSFVVFSEQSEYGAEVRELLEATGHARVKQVVSNPEELVEAVRNHRPDAHIENGAPVILLWRIRQWGVVSFHNGTLAGYVDARDLTRNVAGAAAA